MDRYCRHAARRSISSCSYKSLNKWWIDDIFDNWLYVLEQPGRQRMAPDKIPESEQALIWNGRYSSVQAYKCGPNWIIRLGRPYRTRYDGLPIILTNPSCVRGTLIIDLWGYQDHCSNSN